VVHEFCGGRRGPMVMGWRAAPALGAASKTERCTSGRGGASVGRDSTSTSSDRASASLANSSARPGGLGCAESRSAGLRPAGGAAEHAGEQARWDAGGMPGENFLTGSGREPRVGGLEHRRAGSANTSAAEADPRFAGQVTLGRAGRTGLPGRRDRARRGARSRSTRCPSRGCTPGRSCGLRRAKDHRGVMSLWG